MPEIFISYCRKDSDFAEVLRGRLKEAGFSSWIDLEGLQAGEEWSQEIDQAIRESLALVVLLTPASRASGYVAYEWAFALGAGVRVIPILWTATDLPPRLATLQHLDFTDPASRPWKSLLGALEVAAAAMPTQAIPVARSAPALVKEAVAALDHPESEVMETAMRRLAEMRTPEADEVLVKALAHPLPDVRIEAALHLGRRKDSRAVPGLIEGNRRRRWHLELGRKLAEIGSEALPAIREALRDPAAWVRRDLVWAMQAIGDPAAVPDLVRMLDDPAAEVRKVAIRALGEMGGPEGVQAVCGMMDDNDPRVRTAAIRAVKEAEGSAVVSRLITKLDDLDSSVQLEAIEVLSSRGDPRIVGKLLRLFESPSRDVSRAAMNAFAKAKGIEAVAELVQRLKDPNSAIRMNAYCVLGAMNVSPADAAIEGYSLRELAEGCSTENKRAAGT